MANHCIDMVCVSCGVYWCDRGCGERGQSLGVARRKVAQHRAWWAKHYPDKSVPELSGTGERCPNCGERSVHID